MLHHDILVLGRRYSLDEPEALRRHEEDVIREDLADFLTEWSSDSPTVTVHTSGSTGKPKTLHAEKTRMRASARMTCSFLGLKAGDSALLCMPLKYIGAKMVVVRALEYGLDLWCVKPSGHPLHGLSSAPVFAAMTPAQVYSTLQDEEEAHLLRQVRQLIIGGSAVEPELESLLKDFPFQVWSTYGMTESLSHIALRRLNGPEASSFYTPLDGVSVRLTEEGTLAIQAPAVCATEIITNDMAELDGKGRFRLRGRRDNVINSGGIKLHIEDIETELRAVMPCPFQITAAPDPHFGEVVTMLVEEEGDWTPLFRGLHPYARPKHLFRVPSLPVTGSGKPDRATARLLARRLVEKK